MGSFFKWEYVVELFPKILSAVPLTLLIVLISSLIGIVIAVLITYIRLEKIPVLNTLCILYVSFIRGTPILVQMFVVYFGLPALLELFGIDITGWSNMYYIYLTYGINSSAIFSEIFRSSIQGVPVSQMEASASIGLTKTQTYRRILIPQALCMAIPSFGTSIVNLLQQTSLAFTLGAIDVMGKVKVLGVLMQRSIEAYVDAAIIFIVLSLVFEKLFGALEKKVSYNNRSAKPSKLLPATKGE